MIRRCIQWCFIWPIFLLLLAGQAEAGGNLFNAPFEGAPVVIETPTRTVRFDREADRWWVTDGEGVRHLADSGQVERLLSRIKAVNTERSLTRYGAPREGAFADPLHIRWGMERVDIGGESRIPGLVYVRRDDGSIHLIKPLDLEDALTGLFERRLFPDGLDGVREVRVEGRGMPLSATRANGPWLVTTPNRSLAEEGAVERWVRAVGELAGDPVEAPLSADSVFHVHLKFDNGEETRFDLAPGGYARIGDVTLRLDPSSGTRIPTHFDWLKKRIIEGVEGITRVEVQQAEKTVNLIRDENTSWVERDTGLVFRTWTKELFDHLTPLTAIGVRTDGSEKLGPAQVEIRLWNDTQLATSIELWLYEGHWWARGGKTLNVYEIGDELPEHLARIF